MNIGYYIKDNTYYSNRPGIPHITTVIQQVLGSEGELTVKDISSIIDFSTPYILQVCRKLQRWGIVTIQYHKTGEPLRIHATIKLQHTNEHERDRL